MADNEQAPLVTDRDPVDVKQRERRWQDRQGGALQHHAYARPGTRVVLDGQLARLEGALRLAPGMRVLDLGCGVGYLLAWLSRRASVRRHGLDLSLASLQSAAAANPTARLTLGDAEQLPYQDGSFDRVACNGAAHHFLDEHSAFREMYRVLAPDGLLVLYEPTANVVTNVLRKLLLRGERYESPVDLAHKAEFTPSRARAVLLETGFSDIRLSLHDALAYPLTGNYMGSPLSGLRSLMSLLYRLEQSIGRVSALKRVLDVFAWRLLVVATKPRLSGTAARG